MLQLLFACSELTSSDIELNFSDESIASSWEDSGLIARRATSPPGIGRSRISFAFQTYGDQQSGFRHDLRGIVEIFRLNNEYRPVPGSEESYSLRRVSLGREESNHKHADGTNHVHNDPVVSVYASEIDFQYGGVWGAKFIVKDSTDLELPPILLSFLVQNSRLMSSEGSAVPATIQPIMDEQNSIESLSSANPANPEMHQISIRDALELGKPVIVSFVTPSFCQTKLCGPVLEEAINPNYDQFNGEVIFIHVEPYDLDRLKGGEGLYLVPAMAEWGLTSEPWVFVIDTEGKVRVGLEGITDAEELSLYIGAVLN